MKTFKFIEPKIAKRLNLLASIILTLNWIGSIILLLYVLSDDTYGYFEKHMKTEYIILILTSFIGLLILSGCIRGFAETIRQKALSNAIQLNIAKSKGIMLDIDESIVGSGITGVMEGYEQYKSNS